MTALTCTFAASAISIGHQEAKTACKESILRQLINENNQLVMVEIHGNSIHFNDPLLETQMKTIGILIPPSQRKHFQDRTVVKLTDPQFLEAFEKYYIPLNLDKGPYIWKEVKTPS